MSIQSKIVLNGCGSGGKEAFEISGGGKWLRITRNDLSCYAGMSLVSHKSDLAETPEKILPDFRVEDISPQKS